MRDPVRNLIHRAAEALISLKKSSMDLGAERLRSLAVLSEKYGQETRVILEEYRSSPFRARFMERARELPSMDAEGGTTSDFDLETLYIMVRLARPERAVETGVLYGASSSHILEAMRRNGTGRLYSIDLPFSGTGPARDLFIEEDVRPMWELVEGDSREVLPELLDRIGSVDFFFHDSSHEHQDMLREYRAVYPALTRGGALSSHDVIGLPFFRNAFREFCSETGERGYVFRNVGVLFKTGKMGGTGYESSGSCS